MNWRAAACILTTCVLTACGGGGGGSPSATPQDNGSPSYATVQGMAIDASGDPLAGVKVSLGDAQQMTDAKGRYTFTVSVGQVTRTVVQFHLDGYADQTSASDLPLGAEGLRVNATLRPVTLSAELSAGSQSELNIDALGKPVVDVPANALVRADGSAPAGNVKAQVTIINPKADLSAMPGNYLAKTSTGTQSIESFGALQVILLDQDGAKVNLKGGQTALIRIPAVKADGGALPTTVPLYHFDEQSGYWEADGSATLGQDSMGRPYYEGTVSHFSTWNADQPYETVTLTGCVEDTNGAAVTSSVFVVSVGSDYLGSSLAQVDSNGQFSIAVKKSAVSGLRAVSYSPTAVSAIVPVIVSAVGGPVASCLRIDLASALLKSYAGTYAGTFTGKDQGSFTVAIGNTGAISGSGASNLGNGFFGITGSVTPSGAVSLNAASGEAGIANFSGTVNGETGVLTGTWQYDPSTGLSGGGTYQGQRQ